MQREEIRFMVERDWSAKAIVFSQFTSFLDLISYALGKVISSATNYKMLLLLYLCSFNILFNHNETLNKND